jgi:hypothetical protein
MVEDYAISCGYVRRYFKFGDSLRNLLDKIKFIVKTLSGKGLAMLTPYNYHKYTLFLIQFRR